MPKLTIKSWQDGGRLRLIPAGMPLEPAVRARLATPTVQQLRVLQAWDDVDAPPLLHLFPFTDMSHVTEARFMCSGGTIEPVSTCARNRLLPASTDITLLAEAVVTAMPSLGAFVLQIAIAPDGVPRILDINPGLSPTDLAELKPKDAAA